jgi:hypothetical protein
LLISPPADFVKVITICMQKLLIIVFFVMCYKTWGLERRLFLRFGYKTGKIFISHIAI